MEYSLPGLVSEVCRPANKRRLDFRQVADDDCQRVLVDVMSQDGPRLDREATRSMFASAGSSTYQRGRSSIGRARALQARGWRFEPARLHLT